MWGVFRKETETHVVPCDKDGNVRGSHIFSFECECHPENIGDDLDCVPIFSHNEVH